MSADNTVLIKADPLCGGSFRETGHCHYIIGQCDNEDCTFSRGGLTGAIVCVFLYNIRRDNGRIHRDCGQ